MEEGGCVCVRVCACAQGKVCGSKTLNRKRDNFSFLCPDLHLLGSCARCGLERAAADFEY
jgi:hypothetical protein